MLQDMNQFTVPQFIDVEDKIIGPVTTRQFIIMLVVGLFIFLFYKIFTFGVFIALAVTLFAGGATIAFVRINGQPFHFFLLNILQTWRSPAIQLWDKTLTEAELRRFVKAAPLPPKPPPARKEPVSASRLAEIALTVDTGGVYTPEA